MCTSAERGKWANRHIVHDLQNLPVIFVFALNVIFKCNSGVSATACSLLLVFLCVTRCVRALSAVEREKERGGGRAVIHVTLSACVWCRLL